MTHQPSANNRDVGNARRRALIDAYGADPARWPADQRHLFPRDGEASSEIQEALNEASDLDRNLNALAEPVAQPTFRVRLNEIPDSAAPTPLLTLLWPFGNIWKPAAGLVAAALVGLFVGTIEPGLSSSVGTSDVDVLSALGWTAIGDLPELEVY